MRALLVLVTSVLVFGRCAFSQHSSGDHDVQFIQIFFHSGLLNELDTFHGTYQKDLVLDGTIKTSMWLTTREQEIILTKLERVKFFSLPDTVHRPPNVTMAPDPGPQVIRIKYRNQDKTVVWYYPFEPHSKVRFYIESLRELLMDIVVSKPEYKALPEARGGYQ